jgi:hypothetical protein
MVHSETLYKNVVATITPGVSQLHSKWEDPYLVLHVTEHGTVTIQCDDGDTFKANGQHLTLFLVPNPHDFEELDVLNFPEIE